MMKSQLLVFTVIAGMFIVAGCGIPLDAFTSSRFEAFRECREYGFDDDSIDSFFIVLESDKNRGFSAAVAIAEVISSCDSEFDPTPCLNCGLALIDAVY